MYNVTYINLNFVYTINLFYILYKLKFINHLLKKKKIFFFFNSYMFNLYNFFNFLNFFKF